MKAKLSFLLGAAAGYILGARAGRSSYERIKASAKSAWAAEPIQETVAAVQDKFKKQTGSAVHKLVDQVIPSAKSDTAGGTPADGPNSTGASPLDIVPEVSDEFPDAALDGGESQHWREKHRSRRDQPRTEG
ncbi:hypothetical protein [Arthrobacter sp. PAMC 25486]|uniref:hypothetical protein n=1 Tax=Arthrobacter sp. PAMC 25486 TaxID=1494608 RepID=UPI00068B11AB|nr:hypothetical protein [Arthrobacter sp. PAMC 25486]